MAWQSASPVLLIFNTNLDEEALFTWPSSNVSFQRISVFVKIAFEYFQMCIHRYRVFARFGLMHMAATNMCVWLRTVIAETIRDVTAHAGDDASVFVLPNRTTTFTTSTTTTTTTAAPEAHHYAVNADLLNQTGGRTQHFLLRSSPTYPILLRQLCTRDACYLALRLRGQGACGYA